MDVILEYEMDNLDSGNLGASAQIPHKKGKLVMFDSQYLHGRVGCKQLKSRHLCNTQNCLIEKYQPDCPLLVQGHYNLSANG